MIEKNKVKLVQNIIYILIYSVLNIYISMISLTLINTHKS